MKKRILLVLPLLTVLTSCHLGAWDDSSTEVPDPGTLVHEIIDEKIEFNALDDGYLRQAEIDGKLFDAIGYEESANGILKIKQTTPAEGFTYKGMFYNRSVIEKIGELKVKFQAGKNLYWAANNYLMEDMSFPTDERHKLTSDVKVEIDSYYFVIYTDDTSGVEIESIDIGHYPYPVDFVFGRADELPYGKRSEVGEPSYSNARSTPSKKHLSYDLIDITNRPDRDINNYSNEYGTGSQSGNPNSWFRWNGLSLAGSKDLGTEFSVHTTIIGSISHMIDENKYFCYSVWPQFRFEGSQVTGANQEGWVYAMLGNDDYEPLGHVVGQEDGAINKNYASFSGRFFTGYSGYFDPDTTKVTNNSMTYRELFASQKLPFWHLEYKIFKDGNDYKFAVIVNGVNAQEDLLSEWMFDTPYNGSVQMSIERMELHVVNYGKGRTAGSGENVYDPQDAYSGTFTNPRYERLPS